MHFRPPVTSLCAIPYPARHDCRTLGHDLLKLGRLLGPLLRVQRDLLRKLSRIGGGHRRGRRGHREADVGLFPDLIWCPNKCMSQRITTLKWRLCNLKSQTTSRWFQTQASSLKLTLSIKLWSFRIFFVVVTSISSVREGNDDSDQQTHTLVCVRIRFTWKCFRCFRIKLDSCSRGITSFLCFTYIETLHVQKRFWHQLRRRRRRWHKRNMFPNLFEFLNNFGPLRCYNFESTFCDDSERVRVFYFERESVYFLLPVC